MARVYTFTMVIVGMSILLGLAGLNTGAGAILEFFGLFGGGVFTGDAFKISSFYDFLFSVSGGLLALGAVGGLTVGFFARSAPVAFVLLPFMSVLASFVVDIVVLIQYASATYGSSDYVTILVGLIMAPIAVGYAMSIIDFWRGTD